MKLKNLITNLDVLGSSTSMLCAIHCALLPILLSLGAINGQHWIYNDYFELIVLTLTFIFVFFSIIKPYISNKQNAVSFYIACVGLMLLGVHHTVESFSTPIVVTGGILVAFAHLYNLYRTSHFNQAG